MMAQPTGTQAVLANGRKTPLTSSMKPTYQGFSDVDGDMPQVKDLRPLPEFDGSFKDNNNGTWTYTPEAKNAPLQIDTPSAMDVVPSSKPATALSPKPLRLTHRFRPVDLGAIDEDGGILITKEQLLKNSSDIDGDALLSPI